VREGQGPGGRIRHFETGGIAPDEDGGILKFDNRYFHNMNVRPKQSRGKIELPPVMRSARREWCANLAIARKHRDFQFFYALISSDRIRR
jgi:hypothetical protein